jgi:hypothetical protein
MSVKKRVEKLQKRAENDLAGLLAETNKIALNVNKEGRKLVEEATMTTLTNHEAFLKSAERVGTPKFAKEFEFFLLTCAKINRMKGKLAINTAAMRKNYNAWRGYMQNIGAGAPGSMQQSHKDYNVIGQRCFIIYTSLVQAGKVLQKEKGVEISAKEIADNQRHAEAFRRLYMTAIAISRAPNNILGNTSSIDDMDAAVDHFYTNMTQADWEVEKSKTIDVLSGKAEQELVLVKTQSAAKRDAEYEIGKYLNRVWSTGTIANTQMRNMLSNSNFTKLKGSKVLEDELVKQTTDLLMGKIPKPYKSRTKAKKKLSDKGTVKGSKKLKALKRRKSSLKIAALASGSRLSEKGSEESVKNLLTIKRSINKRLPAEVRRNMGRPALINRTGIFSNSVELKNLRSSKKGISGEYTYMRTGGGTSKNRGGVYETFENTGKRRWPAGYNPKPLITKSIRNLAMEYTEKKFTYLRRV